MTNKLIYPRYGIIHKMTYGKNVKIGEFCVIGHDVVIGDNVIIGNYCEIGNGNVIGDNCIIQGRVRMADNCIIENDVTVKYGVILTSKVTLKKGCFIGPNVITIGSTAKRETIHGTTIGENTFVGASTNITVGINICKDVIIGAMSFVNKNITEPGTYIGQPVRKIK